MKPLLALLLSTVPIIAADPVTVTNSLGMKLVRIPPGEFIMGNGTEPPKTADEWNKRDYDEVPAHKVKITKEFYLGTTEVTNAQFEQFDAEHKKLRGKGDVSKTDDEPVTYVTWQQVNEFCAWLSKKESKPYRLPTEAEWEYACRAGTTTRFNTGDTLTAEQANVGLKKDGKTQTTVPVASYKPNPWGLFDMHGNVLEWCLDWHGPYDAAEQTDPVGRADGYAKVARGWCFHRPERARDPLKYWHSSNRSGFLPEDANRLTGFRVVQGEMPTTKPLPIVLQPYQKDVKQTAAPTEGPDAGKPHYVNWAGERKNPSIAADAHGPVFEHHNHFAAVCVCPNGDVLMAWYTCMNEPGRELAQACSRLRVGADKWEPASLFFDVPDVNDHAPVLLTVGKRIYHFCTQSLKGWDYATDILRYSDDNGVAWSKPTIMLDRDDPKALSQPCSAFANKDGKIVLACDGDVHRDERLLVSGDGGKTWKVGAGDMRATAKQYAIHPAIAPCADGRIINFLRGPNPMPVQFSNDLGTSWTQKDSPFPGIGGGQKATALRLASGALLLVNMDNKGVVAGKTGTFAALSFDDGATWAHVRKLDGVQGYMSSAQAPNGVIHVVGTKMSAVAFNEAWLKEGKAFPAK
ncbi:MAG TPA: SUMF1/EgtB/PvdO family nonheme iron enzyme [Gemmataceae bacterium]|jgi:formylglycine-generating enzyme required for sulfatase activity|nr:SUMF1/EgtB/PvdO family nonheme iron enzyme [Gemmataceae bacterium]